MIDLRQQKTVEQIDLREKMSSFNEPVQTGVMVPQINQYGPKANIGLTTATRRIAIVQSNYIPWKGYFDMIAAVDEFILYDDVQFTKNDWRNRNKIKTPNGTLWLTIPVYHSLNDRIRDVKISQSNWNTKHWKSLQYNYARASAFVETRDFLGDLYARANHCYISELNYFFIFEISRFLGIHTKISFASDYSYEGDKSMKVLSLCKSAGGDVYLSGPSAQSYLDLNLFRRAGVTVEWMDYSDYPSYRQVHGEFDHKVSIIDLILHAGKSAPDFMKHVKHIDQPKTVGL